MLSRAEPSTKPRTVVVVVRSVNDVQSRRSETGLGRLGEFRGFESGARTTREKLNSWESCF